MTFEVSTHSFNLDADDNLIYRSIKVIVKNPYNPNYVVVLYIKTSKEEETSQIMTKQNKAKFTIYFLKKYITKYCVGNPHDKQINLIYMGKICKDETKLDDLKSFDGKYMMHMLFKEKIEYAKSLIGFMNENNIYRSSDSEPKRRRSYYEEDLRMPDDDVDAKLEYSQEDLYEYNKKYIQYQLAYYATYGVYFAANLYQFEDYIREEAEKNNLTSSTDMGENCLPVERESRLLPVSLNMNTDLPEEDHIANENETETDEKEENWLSLIYFWSKSIIYYGILFYVLITNVIGLIIDEDVPVTFHYCWLTVCVVLGTAHSITFIIDRNTYLSTQELTIRFGVGLIASLYPDWNSFEIKRTHEEEQQALINHEE